MRLRHSGSIIAAKLCFSLMAVMAAHGLGQSAWSQPNRGQQPESSSEPYPGGLTQGGPIRDGRRVPFGRDTVEERQRAAGVAADAERERRQLEELNALSRQLTPPGTPLPAPNLPSRP